MIWSNEYLDRLRTAGEEEIARQLKCIIARLTIPIEKGQSEFTLPDYVIDVRKIYWKGFRLEPISDMQLAEYGYDILMWVDGAFNPLAFTDAFNIGTKTSEAMFGAGLTGGRPLEYMYYGFGENVVRLRPAADETLTALPYGPAPGDQWYGPVIKDMLVVEFYRTSDPADPQWRIPQYFRRRTLKSYVLWKAFAKEGPGQNIKASEYHKARFAQYMVKAKAICSNVYRAFHQVAPSKVVAASVYGIEYSRESDYGYQGPSRMPRPVLPINYGIVVEGD